MTELLLGYLEVKMGGGGIPESGKEASVNAGIRFRGTRRSKWGAYPKWWVGLEFLGLELPPPRGLADSNAIPESQKADPRTDGSRFWDSRSSERGAAEIPGREKAAFVDMSVLLLVRTKRNTIELFNYLFIYFLGPESCRTKKNTPLFWRPQLAGHQASQGRFRPKSAEMLCFLVLFMYSASAATCRWDRTKKH